MKIDSTESRFVIRPSNILFAGVHVSIFQPGNITGRGSEGVPKHWHPCPSLDKRKYSTHLVNPRRRNVAAQMERRGNSHIRGRKIDTEGIN